MPRCTNGWTVPPTPGSTLTADRSLLVRLARHPMMRFGCPCAPRLASDALTMNIPQLVLSLGLVAALAFGSGCRRRKSTAPAPPDQPAVEEVTAQAPPPGVLPAAPPPGQDAPVTASVDTFQASTEFEDLSKDFQLYCEFKGHVPTDINEFFRDQKIRPPPVPPGTRLAIDPVGKRVILTK